MRRCCTRSATVWRGPPGSRALATLAERKVARSFGPEGHELGDVGQVLHWTPLTVGWRGVHGATERRGEIKQLLDRARQALGRHFGVTHEPRVALLLALAA